MKIKVLTIFPEMLRPMLETSILKRAIEQGIIEVELIDIRPYSTLKHKNTDDYPFGGGPGMVMLAQPIVDAVEANTGEEFHGKRLYLSPRGRTFDQKMAEELSKDEELLLLCGHYEGVDQRALDLVIDGEVSIGDYVLTGGELGALVIIDAVSRLIPGVLGSDESSEDESFSSGLLEYPQYTRPREYRGLAVPDVLLSVDHAKINLWRRDQSLQLTYERRPEMLENVELDKKAIALNPYDYDHAGRCVPACALHQRGLSEDYIRYSAKSCTEADTARSAKNYVEYCGIERREHRYHHKEEHSDTH